MSRTVAGAVADQRARMLSLPPAYTRIVLAILGSRISLVETGSRHTQQVCVKGKQAEQCLYQTLQLNGVGRVELERIQKSARFQQHKSDKSSETLIKKEDLSTEYFEIDEQIKQEDL